MFPIKTNEVESPLDKINEAAAREKSIRHGHLSNPYRQLKVTPLI
ncbi:DUF1156 domain-containing protein [Methylomonas sp. LWB]|nr:DUF1156 domain-containing protein [Methylococcaceae bacterium WWC4]